MKFLIYMITLISGHLFGQGNSLFNLGVEYNVDLWKPYTENAQSYLKENDQVTSNSWSLYSQARIANADKWNLFLGASFRQINHTVVDRIKVYKYSNGFTEQTYTYNDPADLISSSKSFGINFDFNRSVLEREKLYGAIGIGTEVYLTEFYKSHYVSDDLPVTDANGSPVSPKPMLSEPGQRFLLSSANLAVFYRATWQLSQFVSVGAKVSLNSNLYSDWDQFKRYAWLGLGLEVGFGKVRDRQIE